MQLRSLCYFIKKKYLICGDENQCSEKLNSDNEFKMLLMDTDLALSYSLENIKLIFCREGGQNHVITLDPEIRGEFATLCLYDQVD